MRSPCQGLICGLLLAGMIAQVQAGDILLNGDFSDGKTHWHGSGEMTDSGGALVITLNPDKWTALAQRFNAEAGALKLKITYSLSDDCTLGKTGDKLIAPLTPSGLEEACGVENNIFNVTQAKSELWTVLVVSGGMVVSEDSVAHFNSHDSSSDLSGDKTFTADLSAWFGHFVDCYLCLCFPPGQGTVTLTDVGLTPPEQ
jgi:hypothetical protein